MGGNEQIELVRKRAAVMEPLAEERLGAGPLSDRIGPSRSTVSRALRELRSAGLVERVGEEYTLTAAGQLGLRHYQQYRASWADLIDAEPFLSRLDAAPPVAVVAAGEVIQPESNAVDRLADGIGTSDRVRLALPTAIDGVRQLFEQAGTTGDAELLVPDSVREALPGIGSAAYTIDGVRPLTADVPAPGLALTTTDDATRVTLFAVDDGRVAGLLHNETANAVRWAERRYEELRENAKPVVQQEAIRKPSSEE